MSGGSGDLTKNIAGVRTVLGQAIAAGCDPVVYTSTVGIFIPPVDPLITVDSPLGEPRSNYSRSKVAAEHYTRGLADAGAPIVVFYPGGVTGPDQPVLDSNMEGIAESLRGGLPVCSSGGVSVIDVRDLAARPTGEGHRLAGDRESTEFMTTMTTTDDSALHDELGITFRPAAETLADAFRWLVHAGHLEPRFTPKL